MFGWPKIKRPRPVFHKTVHSLQWKGNGTMSSGKCVDLHKLCVAAVFMALAVFSRTWAVPSYAQEKPQYGGTLTMALAYTPPSYDAHRETTIGTVQPTAPHYSLLLKIDPDHYPKAIGDLAESWTISQDQRTYTFKIRKGVRFHDGSPLTAKDVKSSYDKIIFPPPGDGQHPQGLVFGRRKSRSSG
jgi:peptide/nickel transport system substrate-binding protein